MRISTEIKYILTVVVVIFVVFAQLNAKISYADVTPTPTDSPTPTLTITPTGTPTDTPTIGPTPTAAPDTSSLDQKINDLKIKLSDTLNEKKTLSSQITIMDNQIQLTQLQINQTKQQITDLTADIEIASKKITVLEQSLDSLVKVLFQRVIATYESGSAKPLQVLLSSGSVSDLFIRSNYLRIAQDHDKQLIFDTQQAKNDYANQKQIFEDKKKKVESLNIQLVAQTQQLDQEKKDKQVLLHITENNEAIYQQQLQTALAERDAIAQISAGGGDEVLIGAVGQGDVVAHIISGASPCSSGTHLHFEVHQNDAVQDPSNYLSNSSFSYSDNDNGDSEGAISPHGSWAWPLDGPILITQGYGMTPYARSGYYGGGPHTGIDMFSQSSSDVHAVQPGELYRGSIKCGSGNLLYSKVVQSGGIDTLYLHTLP